MRILQLCHKPPFPPKDGGCLAISNISCGLADSEDVKLDILTIETEKHPFTNDEVPEAYRDKIDITAIHVDTSLNMVDAFSSLITSDSYNVSRFFTPDVDIKLTQILRSKKYDIIHLESLFVTPYIGTIRRLSKAKIVLRSHNLEFMIWERLALKSGNRAKKTYLKVLAKQLKRYELATLNDVDGLVSISFEDEEKYKAIQESLKTINIPFGVNMNDYEPAVNYKPKSFFHLGSLEWKPNFEGVKWFLKKVWPIYHAQEPEAEFLLAGRNIPEEFSKKQIPGLKVVGEVENAQEFIKSAGTMIVPILAAGGIRVKIIEGMALKVPIISTSVGAEGIHFENNKHILVGDTPEDFAAQMLKTNDVGLTDEITNNALQLVRKDHNNTVLIEQLLKFYQDLLEA